MFVRDFAKVPLAQDIVVSRISQADTWVHALDSAFDATDRQVLARYGMRDLVGDTSPCAQARICSVVQRARGVVIGLEWQPTGRPDWEPEVQAEVTVAALGPQLSHLEFDATYSGRKALSPAAADRVVQHRALEYAVRLILNELVKHLTEGARV
ncbi:MAG: hypothetical protein RL219_1603 [Actinomycetota bacterium]|jgi:hypothetical protein